VANPRTVVMIFPQNCARFRTIVLMSLICLANGQVRSERSGTCGGHRDFGQRASVCHKLGECRRLGWTGWRAPHRDAVSREHAANQHASRTKSAARYVVIYPQDPAHSEGDAGWGPRGAFVAMQENALERLGGHVMGAPRPLPPRLVELGVDRPRVAFSEVLTFDLNGEGSTSFINRLGTAMRMRLRIFMPQM